MIHHTIIPPELIFPEQLESFSDQVSLTRNGVPMVVEQSGNMYKIVRIMSSDPADYLNSELHPGSYIPI
ncbi:YlzJ-like family protein [Lederbergia lenta]|uniref:YlzJ-like family protein n=1 Tax=Lederbergia lenta TaxID=1467 RepID=UPI00203F6B98|nr:YlzJ-like family protein [Lederbergia lenta]MCM3110094.1 YlzJ-like family protein [Lederbergia lenta]